DVVINLDASDPESWTATVTVLGGGIRPSKDRSATRAPEDGYTDSLTIQGGKDSPTPYREKAFAFVRLKDDTYAALLIGVRTGRYDYFFIEGIWNTLGETDLR
ncbi:MAG: hypothetical protein O7C75_15485, partial [Verrucomicrobia bacterium]|nr:hypothetical protein [Verrucomicrobiota bacterium]